MRSATAELFRQLGARVAVNGPCQVMRASCRISRVGRLEWRIIASDDLRNGLVPLNRKYPIVELLDAGELGEVLGIHGSVPLYKGPPRGR